MASAVLTFAWFLLLVSVSSTVGDNTNVTDSCADVGINPNHLNETNLCILCVNTTANATTGDKCIFVETAVSGIINPCSATEKSGEETHQEFHNVTECQAIPPAPPTTPTTTTTTTTTTPAPTTTSSTTTSPTTTTTTTTTPSTPTTTTPKPTTTTPSSSNTTTTAAPSPATGGGGINWGSFFGGIAFTAGVSSVAYVVWRFYKARTERNYHTLNANLI